MLTNALWTAARRVIIFNLNMNKTFVDGSVIQEGIVPDQRMIKYPQRYHSIKLPLVPILLLCNVTKYHFTDQLQS